MKPNPTRVFLSTSPPDSGPGEGGFRGIEVQLRELFADGGFETLSANAALDEDLLVRLDDQIRRSDLVVQFPGSVEAPSVPEAAVLALQEKLDRDGRPFSIDQPEAFRCDLGTFAGLTLAEWESYLAIHHRIPLACYTPPGPPDSAHFQRLRLASPPVFPEACTDGEDLAKKLSSRLRFAGIDRLAWEPPRYPPRPAFVVGITGLHRLPEDAPEILRNRLRQVFAWLRKQEYPDPEPGFGPPLGLKRSPIVLLTSLAPGVEQLAAEVALEENIEVRCPLPFPQHLYRRSSTFLDPGDVGSSLRRLDQFAALLSRIGVENTFPVRHKLDDSADAASLENDLLDRERRNLRYRAAAEYVATNCDMLVAICDQENPIEEPKSDGELTPLAQSGSRIIINSYINGIESGILPIPPSLSWQENGPVIRIFCPDVESSRETRSALGDVRIWHPADSEHPERFHHQIHEQEMTQLRRSTRRLESFNADLAGTPKKDCDVASLYEGTAPFRPENYWERFLAMMTPSGLWRILVRRIERFGSFLPRMGNRAAEKSLPPLHRLACLIDRTEKAIARYNNQVSVVTNTPFILGPIVYVLLEYHNTLSGTDMQMQAVRSFLGAAALILFVFAIHRLARWWNAFDRKNDYRALIEGARVQFYWAAAGITEAVPRNYIQRLRGEVIWIQSAIRSLLLPVERSTEAFHDLAGHKEKCLQLRRVSQGWLTTQEFYFSKQAHNQSRLHARLRFASSLFLAAGASMIFISFAHEWLWGRPINDFINAAFRTLGSNGLVIWILGALIFEVGFQWVSAKAYRAYYRTRNPDDPYVKTAQRFRELNTQFFIGLLGVSLGLATYSAVHSVFLNELSPSSIGSGDGMFGIHVPPDSRFGDAGAFYERLLDLFRNAFFTLGGLTLGYSVVKFTRENSRRYESMRGQFTAARRKIDRLLRRYERMIERGEPEEELDRMQKSIQDLFVVLGREALHENTDWLLMRRNRPVEPALPVK